MMEGYIESECLCETRKCPLCGGYTEVAVTDKEFVCSYCGETINRHTPVKSQENWADKRPKTDPETAEEFLKVMGEAYTIWCNKHESYGTFNISIMGLKGVFVRMFDKMMRLYRLIWLNRDNNLADEKLEDTLLDLSVYGLIAILIIRNKWPKNPFE